MGAADATQKGRPGQLNTLLGEDKLLLVHYEAIEGLSELFEYRIEALSAIQDIDFDALIGTACSITFTTYHGEKREFNGILAEAQWVGGYDTRFRYRILLRPWLWLLSKTSDCRIFQNKKAPDILNDIFQEAGFGRDTFWKSRLDEGSYSTLEYCVQYRETMLNFVLRLMEKEGIYFYFTYKDGGHVMVLADSISSHDELETLQDKAVGSQIVTAPSKSLPFMAATEGMLHDNQCIEFLTAERRFRSGRYVINDYDYEASTSDLTCQKSASEAYKGANMEMYDYPGDYKDRSVGARYAQINLDAEQARDHRRQIMGQAPSLFPGALTTLQDHPSQQQNVRYLVVRAQHSYGNQSYRSDYGKSGDTDGLYAGQYEVLPSDRPFRAPLSSPRPRIYGVQTAVVVDKQARGHFERSPEEIEVEALTEIYVQFHWDRRKHEDKRSVKLRCAQLWAGKRWGGQFIPRIGMEVLVEFLEGDPDRPLVVGALYNDKNRPPYDLPTNKSMSGIKSDSTKGHNGYNELMFEDKKASELIRMHAERDHLVQINANQTGYVGAVELQSPYPGGDQTWTVGRNRTWTIEKGDDLLTLQMGDQTVNLQMGNQTIAIDMGSHSTSAMQSITLTVAMGLSTVSITPASISLSAPTINILGEAAVNISAPAVNIGEVVNTPELNAAAATVSGIPL